MRESCHVGQESDSFWGILLSEQSLNQKKQYFTVYESSSRNKFTLLQQNSVTDVSVGFRPPCWCPPGCAPTWRLQTELYKFSKYLAYEKNFFFFIFFFIFFYFFLFTTQALLTKCYLTQLTVLTLLTTPYSLIFLHRKKKRKLQLQLLTTNNLN